MNGPVPTGFDLAHSTPFLSKDALDICIVSPAETGRVVQVGINRRGSTAYQQAVNLVRSGKIGKVTFARAHRIDNMTPHGIGRMKPAEPPPGFDWDMWLGPRAWRP